TTVVVGQRNIDSDELNGLPFVRPAHDPVFTADARGLFAMLANLGREIASWTAQSTHPPEIEAPTERRSAPRNYVPLMVGDDLERAPVSKALDMLDERYVAETRFDNLPHTADLASEERMRLTGTSSPGTFYMASGVMGIGGILTICLGL